MKLRKLKTKSFYTTHSKLEINNKQLDQIIYFSKNKKWCSVNVSCLGIIVSFHIQKNRRSEGELINFIKEKRITEDLNIMLINKIKFKYQELKEIFD